MSNQGPQGRKRTTAQPRQRSISDRRHVAVVQAEARRLARILQPFGILSKDQLKVRAGAAHWHEGSFDSALLAAVESGEIERLPFDFYKRTDAAEGSGDGRSTPGA